jgi:hypothetical protein
MRKNISNTNPLAIRIPEELKSKIRESAKKNDRSLNAEMLVRLGDSFRSPLSAYTDGELVAELMSRYERGMIYIRIGPIDSESTEQCGK